MSFTNQDFRISMKGIGQVNRNILENYISNLDKNELSVILYYPSFLYFFFFFLNRKVHLSQNIINYFFQKQTNGQLRRYIQKLNRRMKYISTLKKEELQNIFIYEAKSICQLDNMFLQDIFDPSLIFKSKYEPVNFNIFQTSFYYLMNCKYERGTMDLSIRENDSFYFHFPFDINLKEWCRPIILIDVANVLRTRGDTFQMGNKTYHFRNFKDRKNAILDNKDFILTRLFQKHPDPHTMVLFICQSECHKNIKQTCVKIINLWKHKNTAQKAFLLEVPCHDFVYKLGKRRLFDGNFDVFYDNYGHLYRYEPNHNDYVKVTRQREIDNIYNSFDRSPLIKEREFNIDPRQKNPFKEHVKINSQCITSVGKNELDDYLIGIILLLIQKTQEKCFKLLLRYKPIVFTNDNFSWMKPDLKSSFIHATSNNYSDSRGDFLNYIHDENGSAIESCTMNSKNYEFWLDCMNLKLDHNPNTKNMVDYIRNINNKIFPLEQLQAK